MIHFPKPWADLVARLRVPSGFLMVAAFVWLAAPTPRSLAWGVPVAALGLALRAWAAGHLAKNTQLAVSGPYAYVRNPLYVGTLVTAAGFALAARQWTLAILFGAVFAFVYLPVIQNEEGRLRELFPDFDGYCRRVPMLLPKPGAQSGGGFRWGLYRKNEEYNALLGFVIGVAILLWKASITAR